MCSESSVIFSWTSYIVSGHCCLLINDNIVNISLCHQPSQIRLKQRPQWNTNINNGKPIPDHQRWANSVSVFAGPGLEECIQCAPDFLQQEWRCVRTCAPGYYRSEAAGFSQRMCRKWVMHTSLMTTVLLKVVHSDRNQSRLSTAHDIWTPLLELAP